jgi:general secretion pathway protein E
MGIEPFLVASSLTLVLAQRLVRTICPDCKTSYKASDSERLYFQTSAHPSTAANEREGRDTSFALYRGRGCDRCKGKGYLGRMGIFELFEIDNEIRPMITDRMDSQRIKNHAISKGMKTLRQDGLEKALLGHTTLEEVLRVTQKDYADISV